MLALVGSEAGEKYWAVSSLTRCDRLLEILDGPLLAGEAVALIVVQPPELLKNLGMVGISLQYTLVGRLGTVELYDGTLVYGLED